MGNYAYLAGIVDGEGTITIVRHIQHQRTHYVLRPWLTVPNTHLGLIKKLEADFGGSSIFEYKAAGERHRACHLWRVMGQADILRLVQNMRPYLLVKAPHADVMVKFLHCRIRRREELGGNPPYSEEEFELQREIRLLNRRGIF